MAGLRSIGTLLITKFEDATRKEMDKAYEQKFQIDAPPSLTDAELRHELVKAYNVVAPQEREAPATPISHGQAPKGMKMPQLNATGRWDGRMRRVTFLPQDGSKKQETQPVGWDGIIWVIKLGEPVDMPWPFWEAARNTILKDDGSEEVSKWHHTPDGRLEKHITPSYRKTVNYIDHGDVPGTEDLPIGYADFFHREAVKTQCFKTFNRAALVMVFNKLHEPQPMWYFRDMRDDDIRMRIAMTLGTDVESVLQDTMYEEASA
jgi:hypothetical protein